MVRNQVEAPKDPRIRATGYFVVAAVLTALWAFSSGMRLGATSAPETAFDYGRMLGSLIGPLFQALVVWALPYFGLTRRLTPDQGPRQYAVLALVALIAASPGAVPVLIRLFA